MFRHVSVVLEGVPGDEAVARAAAEIARCFDAHLDGLHATPRVEDIAAATAAAGGMPVILGDAEQAEEARLHERTSRAREAFIIATEGFADTVAPGQSERPSARFINASGRFRGEALAAARLTDLCVAAIPGDAPAPSAWHTAETLLFDTGRPVLFLPPVKPNLSEGFHVTVAWDGSGQASRALHDALPMLRRAGDISLLTVGDPADPASLADTLKCHGIRASTHIAKTTDDAGETIIGYAHSVHSNLIVMGAYGQTRLREFIFGGTTETVLGTCDLPVLMAH